jgi:hypothetical protein
MQETGELLCAGIPFPVDFQLQLEELWVISKLLANPGPEKEYHLFQPHQADKMTCLSEAGFPTKMNQDHEDQVGVS